MSLAIGGAGNHSGWNQMRWRKRSQVVRGFVGQDEGHTGDSKSNGKPLDCS